MRRGVSVTGGLVLAFFSSQAAAQPRTRATLAAESTNPPIEIRTSLSRTAAWVGDPVVYTVELRYAPKFDILLDDVGSDKVKVDGGELLSAEAEHQERGGEVFRRIRYTISSYGVGTPDLRVRAISVRYYATRADGTADGTPAGEVTVPGAVVAVRSTLPEGDRMPAVRQPEALRALPRFVQVAQPVGLALIAIAIFPLATAGLDLVGRARRVRTGHSARRNRRQQRLSLEQLKETAPSSAAARIEAFGQLDTVIRDRLVLAAGVNAHALTPTEVRRVLERRSPSLPHQEVEALLTACESARYRPEAPTAADWERAVQEGEQILTATQR